VNRNLALRLPRALLALIVLLAALSGCSRYDRLVQLDQVTAQRWADVEAQLQRRRDLVPNLVSTVKGSAAHEEKTLQEVIQARAQASQIHLSADDLTDPAKMAALEQAEGKLSGALSRLLVVQERYPDLKANAAFHDLQVQLEGTENRILRAREQYNQAAREYNAELGSIGGMVVNRVTGRQFKVRQYFNASPGAETVPNVTF
jgi:LemA protein